MENAAKSMAKPEVAEFGRRERRKLELRERVEDAAYRLFHEQGVDATTIEQVCVAADVARRTFYSYYSNKRELLAHMGVKRIYARSEPMIAELMQRYATTAERIEGMIDYTEANFAQFDEVDRQIIMLAPSVLTPDSEMHESIGVSATGGFVALIEAGREAGEVSTPVSSEMIATVIMGTLNVLTTQWASDPDFPIIERLEEARAVFRKLLLK